MNTPKKGMLTFRADAVTSVSSEEICVRFSVAENDW